jgi:hypothetical protein
MMLKIVCLALEHRCRVVQEFGPSQRRLKCERCGGDWVMHDDLRIIVDWDLDFEQLYRDHGFEILEPLPAWRSVPVEPLTWSELARATLWPGAIAITVSGIVGHTMIAVAGVDSLGLLATFAVSWGLGRFLAYRAIDRAYERKCNSLQA